MLTMINLVNKSEVGKSVNRKIEEAAFVIADVAMSPFTRKLTILFQKNTSTLSTHMWKNHGASYYRVKTEYVGS